MHETFLYEKRYKYPHMGPEDKIIWERFIDKFQDAYKTCQYDYHVGDIPPHDFTDEAGEALNQQGLYQLKIDVLGIKPNGIDIIEVKPKAGPSSLGQVKGYAALYKKDTGYTGILNTVIITDRLMPNMEFLAKEEGVRIFVV